MCLIDRFSQILIHAFGHQPLPLAGRGVGCHGYDGRLLVTPFGTDRLAGGDAIHDGHLDIHEDEIKFHAMSQFHRLAPVLAGMDFGHQLFKQGGDQFQVGGVIIYGQHIDGSGCPGQQQWGLGGQRLFGLQCCQQSGWGYRLVQYMVCAKGDQCFL